MNLRCPIQIMKRLLLSGLVGLTLFPFVGSSQPALLYQNDGSVNTPQVDAINFLNRGVFQAFGAYPYETSSTVNYTNRTGLFGGSGTMIGSPGFRFDTFSTTTGLRSMAGTFFNDNGAVVQAQDSAFAEDSVCLLTPVGPSYLLISATNIIIRSSAPSTTQDPGVKPSLQVGANGLMQLEGKKVDLTRSGLSVLPVWANATGSFNGETNFQPDVAIFDQYWGRTNLSDLNTVNSRTLWDGQIARAPGVPFPDVQSSGSSFGSAPPLTLFGPASDSYINAVDGILLTITNFTGTPDNVTGTNLIDFFLATNITKGAVFVGTPPGYDVAIGFQPSTVPNNFFNTIGVLFSVGIPNDVSAQLQPAYVFLEDRLASGGTTGVLANIIGCPPLRTFRPANYELGRLPFFPGPTGNNGTPDQNFFMASGAGLNNTNFSLDLVTNIVITNGEFSAYSAFLDNVVSRPQPVQGATVSDLPGRIEIDAANLDLTRARLRAEGTIIIQTANLISSSNAIIDCQNLNFNLTSTNGNLKIQSLVPDTVSRLKGNIYAWSAVWSNTAMTIITNNYDFTNVVSTTPGTTNEVTNVVAVLSPLTNFITIGFHTLILDGTELTTVLPVSVYELATHSTNVVVEDNLNLIESVLFDGRSLTFNGDVTIPGFTPPVNESAGPPEVDTAIQNWIYTNAPNVLNFTNNGYFFIWNESHFGDDRPTPYSTFVNTGIVDAWSIQIDSDYVQNNGTLFGNIGPMTIQCGTGKFENASDLTGAGCEFLAGSLKFNNYQLEAIGTLNFSVTGSLFDAGGASSNVFNVQNGFNLWIKPPTGDLLGTTLETVAPATPTIQINHTWAGQDRGTNVAGYLNNTAVGKLVLLSDGPDPLFHFSGTGARNGLYVDLLDLSTLTDYTNQLSIDPSLVIYYAAAQLSFTPPPVDGIPQQPEEYLNGQFGGRLRWVSSFAGPNSSVDVLVYGETVKVNRALRNSRILDSDSDGVPNYADFDPFDLPSAALVVQINGAGVVIPDYNGKQLALGQSYTVKAIPGSGNVFSNWSGGVSSTSPEVTFTMQSNLVLVAAFAPQAYAPGAGSYSGIFFEPGDVQLASSGGFTASTTASGNFIGTLLMAGKRYSFSGLFNAAGAATNTVNRKGASTLTVVLQVEGANNSRITGTVSDGTWVADLEADRAMFNAGNNPAPFAGNYTLVLPGTDNPGDPLSPYGDGFGAATVDRSGRVRLKGTLADGEKLSQSAGVSQSGRWPLYAPLYKGQGQLLGWLVFTNAVDGDLGGPLSWIKSPIAKARYYPAGFNRTVPAIGSLYNWLTSPGFTNGTVVVNGGGLATSIVSEVTIDSRGKVIDLSDNGLKLNLKGPQGLFKGSVVDPTTTETIRFNGAILQKQSGGSGFFLGGDQSGKVVIGP